MVTKEELIKKMKEIGFEECSYTEVYNSDGLKEGCLYINIFDKRFIKHEGEICLKPVQTFPIILNGNNYQYQILDIDGEIRLFIFCNKYPSAQWLTDKDIQANKEALNKLEELRK